MKKVFATLTVLAMLTFGSAVVMAQEEAAAVEEAAVEQVDEAAPAAEEVAEAPAEEAGGFVALHKTLKTKFIEGGAGFMAATLLCLVFGLALCIERIIYLSLAKTNTKELLHLCKGILNGRPPKHRATSIELDRVCCIQSV